MTLDELRLQARRMARVDETAATDTRVNHLIQNAVHEFTNDVGGFACEVYPEISATFDTDTHLAIRVTIVGGTNEMSATDVAITTAGRSGTTGALAASDFETTLQTATGGSITVSYDDFAFTVDTIDATSITYEEPSDPNYADARALFGLTGTPTLTDYSHTGVFPQDCTVEYTLPTAMMSVERVEWEGNELWAAPQEAAMSPHVSGTPQWYYIRGRTLFLIPSPTTQGLCKVWYRGSPTDIDFDSDTTPPSEIPAIYHRALVFLTASYLLMEQFDDEQVALRYGQYSKIMRQFRLARAVRNTQPDYNDYRRWTLGYTAEI